jgi:hypothetical protein
MIPNAGNHIRVSADFHASASALVRFRGYVGKRIGAFARKHETGRMDAVMNPLMTDDERARLLANGEARTAARDFDPMPIVRLFTPDAHAIWLLAALDPADGDTAWDLCDIGIGMPELGTVRLSSLVSIVGPRDRPVLRDRYFRPARPLLEYARLTRLNGSIPD